MPKCVECVCAEDPSPTVVRCHLKNTYHYIDDEACESFKPYNKETDKKKT